MLWVMLCWINLGPGIHVDVNLKIIIYLNPVADQVNPFMATIFPTDIALFHQDDAASHTTNIVQKWFEEQKDQGVDLASKFPRSHFK